MWRQNLCTTLILVGTPICLLPLHQSLHRALSFRLLMQLGLLFGLLKAAVSYAPPVGENGIILPNPPSVLLGTGQCHRFVKLRYCSQDHKISVLLPYKPAGNRSQTPTPRAARRMPPGLPNPVMYLLWASVYYLWDEKPGEAVPTGLLPLACCALPVLNAFSPLAIVFPWFSTDVNWKI